MPAETNTLSVSKDVQKQFERGFKSWCENTSLGIRTKMGLSSSDPLLALELAAKLNVQIVELQDLAFLPKDSLEYLSGKEGTEWSAVTVEAKGSYLVVVNPLHSPARKSSDIMHELAHIIRKHKSGQIRQWGDIALRDYDKLQEDEANWLASTLLLTKDAVFKISKSEDLTSELERYGVSKSLYNWRMNTSGARTIKMRAARKF